MRVHPVIRVLAAAGLLVFFAVGAAAQSVFVACVARALSRQCRTPHQGGDGRRLRVAASRRADRHVRAPSQRIAEPGALPSLGRRGDEAGRARERPRRAGDGAQLDPRHRERGDLASAARSLAILGLGGTIATPPGGVEGDVLVVSSFDELREPRRRCARPHRPVQRAVHVVRRHGRRIAPEARARRRCRAPWPCSSALSGPIGLRTPHTGAVQYGQGMPPIPAAAIAGEDANRLVRLVGSRSAREGAA